MEERRRVSFSAFGINDHWLLLLVAKSLADSKPPGNDLNYWAWRRHFYPSTEVTAGCSDVVWYQFELTRLKKQHRNTRIHGFFAVSTCFNKTTRSLQLLSNLMAKFSHTCHRIFSTSFPQPQVQPRAVIL